MTLYPQSSYLSLVVLRMRLFFSVYPSFSPLKLTYLCILRNWSLEAFVPIPPCSWHVAMKSIDRLNYSSIITVFLLTFGPFLSFFICPHHINFSGELSISGITSLSLSAYFSSSCFSRFCSNQATELSLWDLISVLPIWSLYIKVSQSCSCYLHIHFAITVDVSTFEILILGFFFCLLFFIHSLR